MKFLEDSLIAGKSYAELDEFLWKLLEVRISVRNIIRNDPERYERVRESVLKYHKENIIEMEDFNLKKKIVCLQKFVSLKLNLELEWQ